MDEGNNAIEPEDIANRISQEEKSSNDLIYVDTKQVTQLNEQKKKPFVCKFHMKGLCNKKDKCEYIHEKQGISFQQQFQQFNCRYFAQGLCNTSCKFKHEALPVEKQPECLPIWFIEFVLNKKIDKIFEEAESEYLVEESKEVRKSILKSEETIFYHPQVHPQKSSIKQDLISNYLSSSSISYVLVNQEDSIVQLYREFSVIFTKDPQAIKNFLSKGQSVVLLIFNSTYEHFIGFVEVVSNIEYRKSESTDQIPFPSGYSSFFQTSWLWEWRTVSQKVNYLSNPLANNKPLGINCDSQTIEKSLGEKLCKFMMKKLTKEETIELFKNCSNSDGIKEKENDGQVSNRCDNSNSLHIIKEDNKQITTENSSNIIVNNISNVHVNIIPESIAKTLKSQIINSTRDRPQKYDNYKDSYYFSEKDNVRPLKNSRSNESYLHSKRENNYSSRSYRDRSRSNDRYLDSRNGYRDKRRRRSSSHSSSHYDHKRKDKYNQRNNHYNYQKRSNYQDSVKLNLKENESTNTENLQNQSNTGNRSSKLFSDALNKASYGNKK